MPNGGWAFIMSHGKANIAHIGEMLNLEEFYFELLMIYFGQDSVSESGCRARNELMRAQGINNAFNIIQKAR